MKSFFIKYSNVCRVRFVVPGLLVISLAVSGVSCRKNVLDVKSNLSIVIPSTLQDFQGILDYIYRINNYSAALGEMSADDYYLPYSRWNALCQVMERNVYTWNADTYGGESGEGDWNLAYYKVFSANLILEGLTKMGVSDNNRDQWNNVKGQALFLRAFVFYQLAQEFAKPYVAANADSDPGIPLRLQSDPTVKSVRATVAETYTQMIGDLTAAEKLLPVIPLYKSRGSLPAATALLARIYLVMGDYKQAFNYADTTLSKLGALTDYNTVSQTASYPFPMYNNEVIYHAYLTFYSTFLSTVPDSNVYRQYNANDLRRVLFYTAGGGAFKGNYTGNISLFGGIAADEIYLIRSEASARLGNTAAAMNDLNALLKTRWVAGTFVPYTASGAGDALVQILAERRKELMYRGTRWVDLRRLNLDSRFAVTLTRSLNGQTYTLPPNDLRYTLLLPPDVVNISGMAQNPR